jgi:effector-binding domain-containing protein
MKFLKILLYVLLALVLIGVLLGFAGPKKMDVERSTVIAASPDAVWPYLSQMKNFQLWSPWAEMDTAAVLTYKGIDGEVGSGYSWEGEKTGKGEQTITAIEPNKSVMTHLHFLEPMEDEADSYFRIEPVGDSTKVIWGMTGENGFVERIFAVVMNFDKMIGKDFDKGLAKLSTVVASSPKSASTATEYAITPGEYAGGKYLVVKGDAKMADLTTFYGTNLPLVMTAVNKYGLKPTTMPLGIYYSWDMEKGMTNMAAGMGVDGEVKAPAGMELITLPANKSLSIKYMGSYHGLEGAHMAMDNHIKANNLEHVAPVLEEYVTDPGTEPDSTKWVTVITYFVK